MRKKVECPICGGYGCVYKNDNKHNQVVSEVKRDVCWRCWGLGEIDPSELRPEERAKIEEQSKAI